MCQKTERIGISVELNYILPALLCEKMAQAFALVFAEERSDSALSRMTERRISHVMCQTRRTNYGSHTLKCLACVGIVALHQFACHIISQRTAYAAHFEAVRQPIVHKHAAR